MPEFPRSRTAPDGYYPLLMVRFFRFLFVSLLCLSAPARTVAADATFFRAINLNVPAVPIDGHPWDASANAKDFTANGKTFENQKVPLKPPTDTARTQMIRSSVWGDKVNLELGNIPAGTYQVFLYVWEDNHN